MSEREHGEERWQDAREKELAGRGYERPAVPAERQPVERDRGGDDNRPRRGWLRGARYKRKGRGADRKQQAQAGPEESQPPYDHHERQYRPQAEF